MTTLLRCVSRSRLSSPSFAPRRCRSRARLDPRLPPARSAAAGRPLAQGYVFSELCKLTHGDPTVCDKIADWCATRLARPEPAIKWKVRRARWRGAA